LLNHLGYTQSEILLGDVEVTEEVLGDDKRVLRATTTDGQTHTIDLRTGTLINSIERQVRSNGEVVFDISVHGNALEAPQVVLADGRVLDLSTSIMGSILALDGRPDAVRRAANVSASAQYQVTLLPSGLAVFAAKTPFGHVEYAEVFDPSEPGTPLARVSPGAFGANLQTEISRSVAPGRDLRQVQRALGILEDELNYQNRPTGRPASTTALGAEQIAQIPGLARRRFDDGSAVYAIPGTGDTGTQAPGRTPAFVTLSPDGQYEVVGPRGAILASGYRREDGRFVHDPRTTNLLGRQGLSLPLPVGVGEGDQLIFVDVGRGARNTRADEPFTLEIVPDSALTITRSAEDPDEILSIFSGLHPENPLITTKRSGQEAVFQSIPPDLDAQEFQRFLQTFADAGFDNTEDLTRSIQNTGLAETLGSAIGADIFLAGLRGEGRNAAVKLLLLLPDTGADVVRIASRLAQFQGGHRLMRRLLRRGHTPADIAQHLDGLSAQDRRQIRHALDDVDETIPRKVERLLEPPAEAPTTLPLSYDPAERFPDYVPPSPGTTFNTGRLPSLDTAGQSVVDDKLDAQSPPALEELL
ncbi:MAG: hypothetical protein AAF449_22595, partial [Myxococcota bacterium]